MRDILFKNTLFYDYEDNSVRTVAGKVMSTSENLTAVSTAYPDVTITIKNGGMNPNSSD